MDLQRDRQKGLPCSELLFFNTGWPRFGYGLGMERFERFRFSVPAVPLRRGFFVCFSTVSQTGRFRFRFLENGSGGSGLAFGSCENGSGGSSFWFWFASWATLLTFFRVRKEGCFGKGVLSEKVHFLELLENLEILEILENSQTVENKGESDHFSRFLANLDILEIREIHSSSEKTPFAMTLFPVLIFGI